MLLEPQLCQKLNGKLYKYSKMLKVLQDYANCKQKKFFIIDGKFILSLLFTEYIII